MRHDDKCLTADPVKVYNKFMQLLYYSRNLPEAYILLSMLRLGYPGSQHTRVAESQFEIATSIATFRRSVAAAEFAKPKDETLPRAWELKHNYPNPFNPSTVIRYQLRELAHVTIRVHDLLGREVVRLVDEYRQAGYHETLFEASSLASGVYFYRMNAGNYTAVKKLVVVK